MALIGYVEDTDFAAYAAARGITLAKAEAVTLTLALEYIRSDQDEHLDLIIAEVE